MKKITITKQEAAESAIERILAEAESEILISVPKFSALGAATKIWKGIALAAKKAGKTIAVESVDDDLVREAAKAGLAARNPFFPGVQVELPKRRGGVASGARPMSDIVPTRRPKGVASSGEEANAELAALVESRDLPEPKRAGRGRPEPKEPERHSIVDGPDVSEEELAKEDAAESRAPHSGSSLRRHLAVFGLILLLTGAGYAATVSFAYARVLLVMKKIPWQTEVSVVAAVDAAPQGGALSIPAQLFRVEKSGVYQFPASGSREVSEKARGELTIWNAFNTKTQSLVARTRFATPDGKVFRLVEAVTVPAGRVEGSKLVPSSVTATVEAEAAGEGYNLGPTAKLRIPGFQGSPRYEGFYGELKEGTAGGYKGLAKAPTEGDASAAKEQAYKSIENALRFEMQTKIPGEFKVLEEASQVTVLKERTDTVGNKDGVFGVAITAEMRVLAFREPDLVEELAEAFRESQSPELPVELKSRTITYGKARPNFTANTVTIPLTFSSVWTAPFSEEEFRQSIARKSEGEVRKAVLAIPGIERATVNLKPFWLRSVPKNGEKIIVEVE